MVHIKTMKNIQTRSVLAGAYKNKNLDSCLTHAIELDSDGNEISALCGKVKMENLADIYSNDITAAPTCKTCAAKLAKL
jgi:hypothetical protein